MDRMVGIFLDFISKNYLDILIVGGVLYFLLYLMIGKASGLFWSFVLEGILSILIILVISFVLVYLAIGF